MDSKRARLIISILLVVAFIGGAPAIASAQSGSLADAYRIIESKEFVDLTHSFSPSTPVWKGFGPATFSAATDPATGRPYTIDHDGFRAQFFAMVGQYGTHIDPPAHFDAAGTTVDEIPVKQMILPIVVFDLTPILKSDPNHLLTVDDIQAWERIHGRVPADSFAALRTDMYKDWDKNPARFERYPFPAWSLAAIRFLYEERGIIANGHESMDTDPTPKLESESWLLKHGHWQIEVMANLDKVPATGATLVVGLPKVKGASGGPSRIFALV